MADPVTLAAGSIASSAASGLLGASGAASSAAATSRMYSYQAAIAQFNKQIALQNRDYAISAGETSAGLYGLKARQREGQIIASQGASGTEVGRGSNKDVIDSQRMVTQMDEAQIRNNAARVAYGYQLEAEGKGQQAQLYEMASQDASRAGRYNVMSSLISGAGSVSSKWLQAQTTGIFPSGGMTSDPAAFVPNPGG